MNHVLLHYFVTSYKFVTSICLIKFVICCSFPFLRHFVTLFGNYYYCHCYYHYSMIFCFYCLYYLLFFIFLSS